MLNNNTRQETLANILPNLCLQRSLEMNNYLAQDLNGKTLSLDAKLGDIPGGEVMFCNVRVECMSEVYSTLII